MEEENLDQASSEHAEPQPRRRAKTPRMQKTLAIFVQSLQGTTIVVELKNDIEITGLLEETDHAMKYGTLCTIYICRLMLMCLA